MNLIQYRSELRLDLKDGSTLWSNVELDRCVQRAVDDLSRFLPLERIYEITFEYNVDNEPFTTPAAASATAIVNAQNLYEETDGATISIADTTPDVPRRLTVTLNDANYSITELTLIVKGYDQDGYYIEESWYLTDLKVSGTAYQGKLYFSRITQVELNGIANATAADTISVGTGNAYDSLIFLANKPIKPKSETVTNAAGTTTYTRDSDYYMDYTNGAIKFINGGNMAAGTAYLIDYDKSRVGIDIGAILPVLTRIHKVYYPVELVPQQSVSFNIIGNFMYIGSQMTGQSQEELASGKHIAIYYERKQMPPGEGSIGSYPDVLDEVICIGAGAYALMMKAVQYEHQSVTDMASARTALGSISAIHTLTATALGKVTTYVADADTALGAAIVQLAAIATALVKIDAAGKPNLADADTALDAAATQAAAISTALGKINNDSGRTYLTDADAALDAAVTALAKIATYLESNTNEDSKSWLTKITTDIAGLRTAFLTAVDAANASLDSNTFSDVGSHLTSAGTALAKVATYLENNTNEDAKSWLTKITTDIAELRTAIATALDAALADFIEVKITDLDKDPGGAGTYLDDGDNKIDLVNIGDRVAALYREYSGARVAIANARVNSALGGIQEATIRLANLKTYIDQAAGWGKIAEGFVNEASQRLSMASQVVNRELGIINQAVGYLREADTRLNNLRTYVEQADGWGRVASGFAVEARERINEASQRLAIADRYLVEAARRADSANTYVNEASQRLAIADRWIAEANGRASGANGYIAEANGRLGMCRAFIDEASGRMAEIDRHVAEAGQYTGIAGVSLTLSDRFRAESTERKNEFWAILKDKAEYRKRVSSTPVKQPA